MSKKAKKAIKAVSAEEVAVQAPATIPEDLENQLRSVRAIAQCYNLLQKGLYPHGYAMAIDQSLQFLQALHQQAFAEAQRHPAAAAVPELNQTQGASNGQTK